MRTAEPESGPPAWRQLVSYVRPHRTALFAGALLSLVTGATGLLLPLVARELIDDLAHDRAITGALLAMSGLVVANTALGALGSYVLRRTAESVVLGARRTLSSYLLRLRIAAVDRTEPGDLMARITSDTTLLREVTTDSLIGLGAGGLTLVATLVMMGVVDAVLLGVTLAVVVGAGTVLGLIVPRINRASRQAQDAVGVMGAALERILGALRTVKASGAEPGRSGHCTRRPRSPGGRACAPPGGRPPRATRPVSRCRSPSSRCSPWAGPGWRPGRSTWARWSRSCCSSSI
ncbi:hypothetical protein STENM327S_04515 [Streptomyces tendae]